jgi:hypothetical protein
MIDYILKFASEAAAKTALSSRLKIGEWPLDYCLPGITMWRESQDVAGTDVDGNPTITHTPLTGYFIQASLDRVLPALRDLAAVQVVVDEELARARRPGAIIKSNVSNAILQDLRWSPVFAGRDNPWGTWA